MNRREMSHALTKATALLSSPKRDKETLLLLAAVGKALKPKPVRKPKPPSVFPKSEG